MQKSVITDALNTSSSVIVDEVKGWLKKVWHWKEKINLVNVWSSFAAAALPAALQA